MAPMMLAAAGRTAARRLFYAAARPRGALWRPSPPLSACVSHVTAEGAEGAEDVEGAPPGAEGGGAGRAAEKAAPEAEGVDAAGVKRAAEEKERELERLRGRLEAAEEQLQELETKKRAYAVEERQARRRHPTDLENESRYGASCFARTFLQVPDNLQRASSSAREVDADGDADFAAMRDEVDAMTRAVVDALGSLGIVEMKALGEVFDPNKHEAMFMISDPTAEPNTVVHVMEPGYSIYERTLRAARVGIVRPPC